MNATAKVMESLPALAPQIGDILVSSWGYDQTNIDFYKVIALNGKTMLTVQRIKTARSEAAGYLADYVVPLDEPYMTQQWDEELGESIMKPIPPARHKIHAGSDWYSVGVRDYANAYLWNGKPELQTYYH